MRINMQKSIILFFLIVKTTFSFAQYGQQGTIPVPPKNHSYGDSYAPNQSGCSNTYLSADEKWFMNQLSSIHQNIFCTQFTPAQRMHAMKLHQSKVEELQGDKKTISPDMAVEIILETTRSKKKEQLPDSYRDSPSAKYPYNTESYGDSKNRPSYDGRSPQQDQKPSHQNQKSRHPPYSGNDRYFESY